MMRSNQNQIQIQNQSNQNQDQLNHKIKNIAGIIAIIIGLTTFAIWYSIALKTYPNVPKYVERIQYFGSWTALALTFLGLTLNSKNRIKQLIFYAASNFYLFLVISYALNRMFNILIRQNKIVFTLILTMSSCVIYYLCTLRQSR